MNLKENIKLALKAIRSNLLRTVLTILIIAFGIMSIVGILTSIDAIKSSITDNFTRMGANTFTIRQKWIHGRQNKKGEKRIPITIKEAEKFKEMYEFPATVSISTRASMISTVKYKSKKTNPNISVMGVDEGYLNNASLELAEGRNLSQQELQFGTNVAILGKKIVDKIFDKKDTVIHSIVSIRNQPYKIIGVLTEKGASMMSSPDNMVLIPVNNARKNFFNLGRAYFISVGVTNVEYLEEAIGEATGTFRLIRKQKLSEPDNFEIAKSDRTVESLMDNIKNVTGSAIIIGLLTLFGASIGLMNILLVSVKERTREIGVSKAIGATAAVIKRQFLVEAIVICQLGGLLGIILGIIIGNLVTLIVGGSFIIPWLWMLGGIALCFVVGISSGIYPAIKASKLDPIEALRYE